jgi:hypothetical protein
MKNSVRRGLFHPDDIKVLGLSGSPGPLSAPVLSLSRKASRSAISPASTPGAPFGPASSRPAHSRSASLVAPSSSGNNGSFGPSDARRISSQTEFDKYTEEDDEDYEDVFGKPNGNRKSTPFGFVHAVIDRLYHSDRTFYANIAAEHPII